MAKTETATCKFAVKEGTRGPFLELELLGDVPILGDALLSLHFQHEMTIEKAQALAGQLNATIATMSIMASRSFRGLEDMFGVSSGATPLRGISPEELERIYAMPVGGTIALDIETPEDRWIAVDQAATAIDIAPHYVREILIKLWKVFQGVGLRDDRDLLPERSFRSLLVSLLNGPRR
jgi:hypothetical protein